MKMLISLLALLTVMSFTLACSREASQDDKVQREEALGTDDLRETDSFERSLPVEEDEDVPSEAQ